MEIGMNLPVMVPGLDRDLLLEWCRRIEAAGFSSLAAGERITFPNPEVMVTLSAAAAVTQRARICFTVVVVPMHDPVLLAKQIATVDVISGGRVSLGVGVGARDEDYRAVGKRYEGALLLQLEKGVSVMRSAWAGEIVVAEAERPVEPLPVQAGGPEVLAGVLMPGAIRRAAAWADGITTFSFGPSADDVSMRFDAARSAWKTQGRERPPRLVTAFWYALGAQAEAQMQEYLDRYLSFMGPGAGKELAPSVLATTPQALARAVTMLEDLGTDEVLLVPTTTDPDEIDRTIEALGSKIG